jgi:hypothetical protein
VNGPVNQYVLAAIEVEGASEKVKGLIQQTGDSLGVGDNEYESCKEGRERLGIEYCGGIVTE